MSCPITESNLVVMHTMLQRLTPEQLERAFDEVVRLYAAAAPSPGASSPPIGQVATRSAVPSPRRPRRGNVLPFPARLPR